MGRFGEADRVKADVADTDRVKADVADTHDRNPRVSEDDQRVLLARKTLRTARFWLDSSADQAGLEDMAKAALFAQNAKNALHETLRILVSVKSIDSVRSLVAEVDEATRARRRIEGANPHFLDVDFVLGKLRRLLEMDDRSAGGDHIALAGRPQSYVRESTKAVLEAAALDGKTLLSRLESSKVGRGRDADVATASPTLAGHFKFATAEVTQFPESERASLVPDVESASTPLREITRWIVGRTGNHNMLAHISRVKNELDVLRQIVGLQPIGSIAVGEIKGDEFAEELDEAKKLKTAQTTFSTASTDAKLMFAKGIEDFGKLSELKAEPAADSITLTLVKDLLVAIGGNAIAAIGASVVRALGKLVGSVASEATISLVQGTISDATEPHLADAFSGMLMLNPDKSANPVVRLRLMVEEMVTLHHLTMLSALESLIESAGNDGLMLASEIAGIRDIALSSKMIANQATYAKQVMVHEWAKFAAALTLGSRDPKNGVSNMDNYFQKSTTSGRPLSERPKNGGMGVAKLSLRITPTKGVDITRLEIIAMNDDLAEQLAIRAEYRLDKIDLPMEVHCFVDDRPEAWAIIAVDEKLAIRGVTQAPNFLPHGWGHDFWATPEKLWMMVRTHRNNTIPREAVRPRDVKSD